VTTNTLPLILKAEPVPRARFGPMRTTTPNVAVVYATGTGEITNFTGQPMTWTEHLYTRYRTRYEVDVSDHRRIVELRSTPLPSRGDVYFFEATVDVGFRVTDPTEVVRRNVRDGLVVVYNHLINVFRTITRGFAIEESAAAESAINNDPTWPRQLPEGITIYSCHTRLTPDAKARGYLHAKTEASREVEVKAAQHRVHAQDAHFDNALAGIRQDGSLARQAAELDALGGRELDARRILMLHLARHPEDTERALDLLLRHEHAQLERAEVRDRRAMELFQFMADRDLVQAVDLDRFRDHAMGRIAGASLPPQQALSAAPVGWQPTSAPPAPAQSAYAPAPPDVVTGQVVPRANALMPVYLVVDESTVAGQYLGNLNDGIRSLHTTLARNPEVADAVRLSVLGYSDDVVARMELELIRDGSRCPWFAARGASRYGTAFQALLDRIPRDVESLKAQQQSVHRPVVFFLSGARPDDDDWTTPYRQLVDRAQMRYAPNIVACGVGDAPAELIGRIATRAEFAFVAVTGTQVTTSIGQYWEFLERSVLDSGRALVSGTPELRIVPPEGFRMVNDLV